QISSVKSDFIFGYNQIVRNIPRKTFSIIFINSRTRPTLLVESLLDLCKRYSIRHFVIEQLEEATKMLKIKKIVAFGILESKSNSEIIEKILKYGLDGSLARAEI
ncbi:hypothetical protein MXB_2017, partial [Myxobolus squamalis]